MILSVVAYVLFFVNFILSFVIAAGASAASAASSSGAALGSLGISALLSCVFGILGLAIFGFWIWGMVAAFTGKATKLPVIGGFAEGLAGGPVA